MNDDPRLTPLVWRDTRLMIILLGDLYESEEPVDWNTIIGDYSSDDHPWRTVENTLYDLIAFGAIHKIGAYKPKSDTRALKLTPLGRAWLDRERIPFLNEDDDDQDED